MLEHDASTQNLLFTVMARKDTVWRNHWNNCYLDYSVLSSLIGSVYILTGPGWVWCFKKEKKKKREKSITIPPERVNSPLICHIYQELSWSFSVINEFQLGERGRKKKTKETTSSQSRITQVQNIPSQKGQGKIFTSLLRFLWQIQDDSSSHIIKITKSSLIQSTTSSDEKNRKAQG